MEVKLSRVSFGRGLLTSETVVCVALAGRVGSCGCGVEEAKEEGNG